jgi:hypothetical protein
MMKRSIGILAVALGLMSAGGARADFITFEIGPVVGSVVDFNLPTGSFSFTPASTNFQITSVSFGPGSLLGLTGAIDGTFTIQTGTIAPDGNGGEQADVSTSGGKFIINDGSNLFTASLDIGSITADPKTKVIGGQTVQYTEIDAGAALSWDPSTAYAGSNPGLQELNSFGNGTVGATFQFIFDILGPLPPYVSLDYLTTPQLQDGGLSNLTTSFSASVTSPDGAVVPVPAAWVMLMTGSSLVGGFGFFRRRRRLLALA